MRILVTGAGGFVGSHLVQAFASAGDFDVVALSRRELGGTPSSPLGRVSHIVADLADPRGLPSRVDAVVHAAANLTGSTAAMLRDNAVATAALAAYAVAAGARRFIYLSSLSIYGDITSPEVAPETPIINPGAYGLTKYLGELALRDAASALPSLAIRLPGVLGRGSVRNFLSSVGERARRGEDITVFNPAAPFNNAAHIGDICRFAITLLRREWQGADAVTIGAAGMTTVRDAVAALISAYGSSSKISVAAGAKPSFTISNRKACDLFGYAPLEIGAMLRRFAAETSARPHSTM